MFVLFCFPQKTAFVDPDELRNAGHNITVLNADPLIVQFEDFLGTEEMEALRALGEPHLKRSTVSFSRGKWNGERVYNNSER